jgi:hypothetical protein
MNNDNETKNSYNAAKTPAVTKTKRRYRNNPVHSVYECLLCQKKKRVPMQLSIRTPENQAVLNVHPGTRIQQPITAKPQNKSSFKL